MTATVHDLLAAREGRHQPGLYFNSDVEALSHAAAVIDELHDLTNDALLLESDRLRLPLAQAASIIRACMRLHHSEQEIR